MLKKYWWKIAAFILLMYTCIQGFLVDIPRLDDRMQQTVRNLFFHVPMWFCMQTLFTVSVVNSILYLRKPELKFDIRSFEYARTGLVFGVLGLITGAIWANYQWGAPWSGDPKQNGTAVALLIYLAYFVLRGSITDMDKSARLGAVYNIFAYAMLFPMIWILPRLTESLHPGGQGSEGNPGLNPNDTTPEMSMVFLPASIGWILLGVWIATLRVRFQVYKEKKLHHA